MISLIREVVCVNEEILKEVGIFFVGDVVVLRNIGIVMREGKERVKEIEEWFLKKVFKKVFLVFVVVRFISEVVNGKC